MLVTCLSMDRLLMSVMPIFLPSKEDRISVSPMWMEVGWGFGKEVLFETMSRHCFIIIQLEFVWHHPCLYIWNAILHALDWGVYLIWTAGDWLEIECRRMNVVRGFVYKMNRIGPRTEPGGTPKLIKVGCESLLLMVTVWVLLER